MTQSFISHLHSCETFVLPTGKISFGTVSERGGQIVSSLHAPTNTSSLSSELFLSLCSGDTLITEPYLPKIEKVIGVDPKPLFNRPSLVTSCQWCKTPFMKSLVGTLHCQNPFCRGRIAGRLISFFGPWIRLTPFRWNDLVLRVPSITGVASLFHNSVQGDIGSVLYGDEWVCVLDGIERIESLIYDAKSSTRFDTDLVTLISGFGIPYLKPSHVHTLLTYIREEQDYPFPYITSVLENAESLVIAGIAPDDATMIAYHALPLRTDLFAFSDMCELFQSNPVYTR